MDWEIMFEVLMSVLFFFPLVIVLGAFIVVGILVCFEGLVSLVRKIDKKENKEVEIVVESGQIVRNLNEAVKENIRGSSKGRADTR